MATGAGRSILRVSFGRTQRGGVPGFGSRRLSLAVPAALVANALASAAGLPGAGTAAPVLAAQSAYAQAVIGDSPISYWRLNDTSGTTAVDQRGVFNGTIQGGATLNQPGPISDGAAMGFSGSDVSLDGDTSAMVPNTFTVEAWVKTTSQPPPPYGEAVIFAAHGLGYILGLCGTGQPCGQAYGASSSAGLNAPNPILDGNWHYLVYTKDTANLDIYVDGQLAATTPDADSLVYSSTNVGIAADPNCVCSYLTGSVAEVALYGSALDASRVAYHYQQSGHGAPTGGVVSATEHSAGSSPTAPHTQDSQGCHCKPVNTAFGNFWHTFSDLSVAGRGVPLSLTHTYSSTNAGTNGPLGYGWTESYAMSLWADPVTGNVTIREENGGLVAFTLSGGVYSAPPRDIATLVKNPDGSYTFTRDARLRYAFNASGQWTGVTDLNGYATTLAYNGSGQLATVTEPAGRALTFGWTGANLTSVSDPLGRSVGFAYNDGQGNLTDVTDANGGVTHFTYDASHRLLTMTDPIGQVVTNVYDSTTGKVSSQTETVVASDRSKDRTTTFAYTGDNSSASGGTVTITDPKGNVVVEHYQNGERVSVTKGSGTPQAATWSYTFDPATLGITSISDPNGHVTRMTYDGSGNLLTTTDPLNRTTTNTYDALNDLLTSQDPKQVTTTYVYDTAGNIQSASTPLVGSSPLQNETTTYNYGDPGHPGDVTSVVDPDVKTWLTTYDQYGNVASTTDPVGDITTYQYNLAGWRTSAVSPRGNVSGCGCAAQHTTAYDYTDLRTGHLNGFGDVGTVTDPLGHTTQATYDAVGDVISRKDGDGNTTQFTHDLAREQIALVRPDQTTQRTDYNGDGTVLDQVDGLGHTTSYGYDALARVTSSTDPLQRTTNYTYDGAGNRLTLVDAQSPRQTTSYTYDVANELTAISYSDGRTPNVTNITYDADSQRTGMTDGTGTSSWAWDSLHRMTSSTNGAGQTVGYGYDLKGQLTSLTYPGSHAVQRGYDGAGRLTSVTDWLSHTTSFTPDPDSDVTAEIYPNGTTATSTYDNADRVTSISDAPTSTPSSPFASFSYGRDGNGQVNAVTSTGVPIDNHNYGYTSLNQLHSVDSATLTYSAADAITQLDDGTQLAYDAADQLTTTAPTPISIVGSATGGDTGSGKTVTLSLPAGILANDQILIATTQQSGKTLTTPTGFTQVASVTSSGSPAANTILYRKTAAGGETQVTLTYQNKFPKAVVAVVYRGLDPNTPIDVQSSATAAAATAVTAPSLTTTIAGDRLVVFGGSVGNATATSWTAPSGMTSQAQFAGQASATAAVFDQPLGAPGATGTRTATVGTAAQLTGLILALRAPVTSFGYDPRGNRLSAALPDGGGTNNYAYDQANRLITYNTGSTYHYDGDGLRTSKTVNGVTDTFTWSAVRGTADLLVDSTPTATTYFIYGPGDVPVEQLTSSGAADYYYHDQLGSTRLLADATGNVVATFTYGSYGKLAASTGTVTTPLLFAGQYRDSETAFYYLRARYYDPSTAQFLTRDRRASVTGRPYQYVAGNPLNSLDPSGLQEEDPEEEQRDIERLIEENSLQAAQPPIAEAFGGGDALEANNGDAWAAANALWMNAEQRGEMNCGADVLGTPFRLPQESLEHILARHLPTGAEFNPGSDDSWFFSNVNPVDLVREASGVSPIPQPGSSRLAYIAADPGDVGIANGTTVTNVYTVITEADGTVVTAFPGTPRWYNGPLP